MSKRVLFIALAFSIVLCAGAAFAHDGSFGSETNPIELSDVLVQYQGEHPDAAPWKGWAYVFVKNTGNIAWGDFHFKIFSYDGSDISNVNFLDASMTGYDGVAGMNPISTQTGLSWNIDNDVVGAELDLFFYNDAINPGETAVFQVYTDNTQDNVNFGLMFHATPVPEPGSFAAMAGGLVGLAGFAWRRRK